MTNPENRIFCRLDGLTPAAREKKRLAALKELGLLEVETIAVFDEATQTAARHLNAPICMLGLMTQERLLLKSAVGLSSIGLMNQLAQSRQLLRDECFCSYVVESHQVLVIQDTATNPVFASSLLVGYYGIRAYLGAPLLTADGHCLGTLAVMDLEPRCFTSKDAEFLAITARWCLSEYERNRLLQQEPASGVRWHPKSSDVEQYSLDWDCDAIASSPDTLTGLSVYLSAIKSIKVKLLTQLTQELRTPLTSVMGMASVLNRQIYGPLTTKQKEYLEIIHNSGQYLVSLVEEIVALGVLDETSEQLHPTSVDIEMLCQQAIQSLFEMARQRQQQLRLSVEPGNRIWSLDKDKVRQMLYYLISSVIHSAEAGGEVRIHISRKGNLEMPSLTSLQIAVWVSHPWLGEGLPPTYGGIPESLLSSPLEVETIISDALSPSLSRNGLESDELSYGDVYFPPTTQILSSTTLWAAFTKRQELNKTLGNDDSREKLGLLLSCHLAELHGGQISIQSSAEAGARYIVSLPQLEPGDERM